MQEKEKIAQLLNIRCAHLNRLKEQRIILLRFYIDILRHCAEELDLREVDIQESNGEFTRTRVCQINRQFYFSASSRNFYRKVVSELIPMVELVNTEDPVLEDLFKDEEVAKRLVGMYARLAC